MNPKKRAILASMHHAKVDYMLPATRAEWADQKLRTSILRGEYAPGEALVISTLAEQLGLSATPLREALRRLASEGLVELQAHGSARVATVDIREATEIYELRQLLEPLALERSVARGDDAYRQRVTKTWKALGKDRIARPSDHAAFHRALLSACDSHWHLRLSTMLADRAGLMIAVSIPGRPNDYNTSNAHRKLMELAVAGESSAAADELNRHLDRTVTALRAVLAGSIDA